MRIEAREAMVNVSRKFVVLAEVLNLRDQKLGISREILAAVVG